MMRRRAWGFVLVLVIATAAWAGDLGDPSPLLKPPFPSKPAAAAKADRLKLEASETNKVTDQDGWFAENRLRLTPFHSGERLSEVVSTRFPSSFRGHDLLQAVPGKDGACLIYGKRGEGGRFVAVVPPKGGETKRFFDFSSWMTAPTTAKGDEAYVTQGVRWATASGGVLYVSNFHRTYATSSGGMNGYISAINISSGKLLWRSAPLVANAGSFVMTKDAIITGYGFTKEKDYLYVLSRKNGHVLERVDVPSGPEWLVRKANKLYVRCYDVNRVYTIVGEDEPMRVGK